MNNASSVAMTMKASTYGKSLNNKLNYMTWNDRFIFNETGWSA